VDIGGVLALRSMTRPEHWPAKEAMQARCDRHPGSSTPNQHCTCGLYAAASPEDLGRSGMFSGATSVVGAIAMWGTVVEHARGARSRFAYPARLRLVCGPCLGAGDGAVDPVSVIGASGTLQVVCRAHRRGIAGPARPAADVQSELLSTYSVDLLPIDRVSRALRTAPDRVARPVGWYFRLALTGIFRLLHVLIIVWCAIWMLGGFLLIGGVVIGVIVNVLGGGADPRAASSVSVVMPSPAPVDDVRLTLPPEIDEPYRGPLPAHVRPFNFAPLCGVGEGSRVELVSCKDRSDLLGFAELTEPEGPRTDCLKGWDAYTRGHHYWICWEAFESGAFAHRWANAPNPFTIPVEEGGALDERR